MLRSQKEQVMPLALQGWMHRSDILRPARRELVVLQGLRALHITGCYIRIRADVKVYLRNIPKLHANFENMVQKIVTSGNYLQFPEIPANIREHFTEKNTISVDLQLICKNY